MGSVEDQSSNQDKWGKVKGLDDLWFWGAIVVAILLRVLPMFVWPDAECTRDECIYKTMAIKILDGEGLTTSRKGWLTAPGYPYLLAFSAWFFGSMQAVKKTQLVMSLISMWMVYRIGDRADGKRTARVATWMFALHPTIIFFVGTMWTETSYTFLLLGAVLSMLWARDGSFWRAILAGVFVGFCVLFRGAATYLAPIWVLAAIWPDSGVTGLKAVKDGLVLRWKHGLVFVVALVLFVAPYSIHASKRHGGFMIADATIGHVMYLGNNDFEPLTFDYGNGMLTGVIYSRYLRTGRRPCSRRMVPPVQSSKCEVKRAMEWIGDNPGEFVSRIPLRCAQMLNPNTFLTRHIRWGYWHGMPFWLKELVVAYIIFTSVLITGWGTVCAITRARGPYGVLAVGTVCYHMFTIAVMYGMTRFRLPLEPLWIIYLAMFFAQPKETMTLLTSSWWRLGLSAFLLPILLGLMWWFLLTGYPGFWT
ncbi:MAG: hypothetical protein HN348_13315 [Proteobacteria bacterium]|jgi:hypothetical protein|nr:hypothetical protein [Pseudomonadota bacterium]